METILMRRRWRWIGHVLRREADNVTRVALHWTKEGKRRKGHLIKRMAKNCGEHNWDTIRELARSKQQWRALVAALHPSRYKGSK